MKRTLVTAIGPGGVLCQVTDQEGNVTQQTLECDTVVVASGVHPDSGLAQALEDRDVAVTVAGNAAQLGRAIAAIRSGAAAGCAI
jgi:hypothetical protein